MMIGQRMKAMISYERVKKEFIIANLRSYLDQIEAPTTNEHMIDLDSDTLIDSLHKQIDKINLIASGLNDE